MNVSKDIYIKIGENLGKIRTDRKKSQQQIATEIGINRENYTSIESGKGERHLKDSQIITLSKLYNVSADYILGLTNETSADINIKYIYETYGLTEQSLVNLQKISAIEAYFKKKNPDKLKGNRYSVIDTINLLLSELNEPSRSIALLDYINSYINLYINNDYVVYIKENGEIKAFNNKKNNKKHKSHITIHAEDEIEILLSKIEQKLVSMRNDKQKQIEAENKNINSKKSEK